MRLGGPKLFEDMHIGVELASFESRASVRSAETGKVSNMLLDIAFLSDTSGCQVKIINGGCLVGQNHWNLLSEQQMLLKKGYLSLPAVLMTDDMVILNPVLLAHIALPKALKVGTNEQGDDILSFSTHMPQMMHKSVLAPMLKEIVELYPHTDIFDAYGHEAFRGVRPIMLPAWNEEMWLLPVVSKNPPIEALKKWAKTQCFAWISPQSWTGTVVKFLEERFPV